jgi:CDP-glycerol glycerophosphotransferase (TagB/SpsB family)
MKTIVNKLGFFIKIPFFYFLTFILGLFIPKRKDLVVIGSNSGKAFSGNGRALYDYIVKQSEMDVYFFTQDKNVVKRLEKEGVKVLNSLSIKALAISSRTKSFAVTHGVLDVLGHFPLFNQNWVYLGHGSGTKALGYLQKDLGLLEKLRLEFMKKFHFITTSDFVRYMFCARHNVKPDRVHITGYPRVDTLFQEERKDSSIKNILYAPTYKKESIVKVFPFEDFNISDLNRLLEDERLSLYIRFHPGQYKESKEVASDFFKSKHIEDLNADILEDVQDFLSKTDILVTDFSSISRDFLYLDRPMIFIMNGLEDLGKLALPIRKEFAFCGYKVCTYKEFEEAVEEIMQGRDRYAEVRRFVRDLMYNHIDNKSSQRVTELIEKLA